MHIRNICPKRFYCRLFQTTYFSVLVNISLWLKFPQGFVLLHLSWKSLGQMNSLCFHCPLICSCFGFAVAPPDRSQHAEGRQLPEEFLPPTSNFFPVPLTKFPYLYLCSPQNDVQFVIPLKLLDKHSSGGFFFSSLKKIMRNRTGHGGSEPESVWAVSGRIFPENRSSCHLLLLPFLFCWEAI